MTIRVLVRLIQTLSDLRVGGRGETGAAGGEGRGDEEDVCAVGASGCHELSFETGTARESAGGECVGIVGRFDTVVSLTTIQYYSQCGCMATGCPRTVDAKQQKRLEKG